MLFQETWKSILNGTKTQTRRPVRTGDTAVFDETGSTIIQVTHTAEYGPSKTLFEVGKSYPVQAGVGKKTVGKITVTAIRRERLRSISKADILKEFPLDASEDEIGDVELALQEFQKTWNTHHQPGQRWQDNPEVWVVEFKLPFG